MYGVVKGYGGDEEIGDWRMKGVREVLSDGWEGRFEKRKGLEMEEGGWGCMGRVWVWGCMEVVDRIRDIEVLKEDMVEMDEKVKEMVEEEECWIIEIGGMGYRVCGRIVGEVGDLKGFGDVEKVVG